MHIAYERIFTGLLGFVFFIYWGFRHLHRAKHVDRLEREGKIPLDTAARIRKKPMKLIGWLSVAVGVGFLVLELFGW